MSTELKRTEKRIRAQLARMATLGAMRPGTLTVQYRNPAEKKTPFHQLSYTHKGRSRSEYVRPESLAAVRREVQSYKKFKTLIAAVTELSLQASRLRHQRECPPPRRTTRPPRSAKSVKRGCAQSRPLRSRCVPTDRTHGPENGLVLPVVARDEHHGECKNWRRCILIQTEEREGSGGTPRDGRTRIDAPPSCQYITGVLERTIYSLGHGEIELPGDSPQESRMKVSMSVDLTWRLATQEAVKSQSDGIEPEHFLEALLKLSELSAGAVEKIATNADVARRMAEEIKEVRLVVSQRGIDPVRLRRTIRSLMGKGDRPSGQDQLHRTQASRDVFESARQRAETDGEDAVTPRSLLVSILDTPTDRIAVALKQTTRQRANAKGDDVPLDPCAWTTIPADPSTRLDEMPAGRRAECRAIVRALTAAGPPGVFVIGEGTGVVRLLLACAAAELVGRIAIQGSGGRRILDLSVLQLQGDLAMANLKKLRKVLLEIAAAREQPILLLPPPDEAMPTTQADWCKLVKTVLGRDKIRCVCHLTPEAYRKLVQNDSAWRDIVEPIWVQDSCIGEIPAEL